MLVALKSGFLCVISDLSTFRRPAVTASPRFSSANTAATPPAAGAGAGKELVTGGGTGGGGGGTGAVGGAGGAEVENSLIGTP